MVSIGHRPTLSEAGTIADPELQRAPGEVAALVELPVAPGLASTAGWR
jgi:hypothetical protein